MVETAQLAEAMTDGATRFADWLIVTPLAILLLGAAVLVMLRRRVRLHPALACALLAATLGLDVVLLARVARDGPVTMTMGDWLPPFGISFTVDLLGALFATFAAIVGLVAALYSMKDIDAGGRRHGFYPLHLLLIAGVTGAFLTGDIFNMYVWFEVLLISSFGLVILGGEREQLDGATKYGFLNLFATTMFLTGTGLLYGATGTLNMADLARLMAEPPPGMPLGTIAALLCFAFAMKAAAFPVHFWLPASYHTPCLVVSGLFAGLLTKVGIYALLRSQVMLFPAAPGLIADALLWVAIATMLVGALGALAHSDIRRAFNYLVVSGIGFMLLGLGLRSEAALTGTILYAIHSMIAMTALYFLAGIIRRIGYSFDMTRLGGLYAASPLAAAMFLVAALAVAGLPPFSGFWPKVALIKAAIAGGEWPAVYAMIAAGVLITIALGRQWLHIFWRGGPLGTADGEGRPTPGRIGKDERVAVVLPVAILVGLMVAIGIWPEPLFALSKAAAVGLLDPAAYIASVFGSAP